MNLPPHTHATKVLSCISFCWYAILYLLVPWCMFRLSVILKYLLYNAWQVAFTVHNNQAPVVQKLASAIHRINLYPVDNAIGFPNTYPLDSDLSGG